MAVSCLFKNTAAINNINSAIRLMVTERINNKQSVLFPEVFSEIRKAGVEIDAETMGTIYNNLFGSYNVNELSTISEVENFATIDFKNELNSLVSAINEETQDSTTEIGKLSVEKKVVSSLSKLFKKDKIDKSKKTDSILKQMEAVVEKAAKSLLPKTKKETVGVVDALQNFFDLENNKIEKLDGTFNTLETLTNAVKKEAENYANQVASKLSDVQADLFKEQWQLYTSNFINSIYDIVLNKSNQNKLVNTALQQVEIKGENIVDINGNVKWSALIEYGNSNSIATKVSDLFYNGIKNKDGNVTKFTREQADRLGDYFLRIYDEKLSIATVRSIGNNRIKNKSAKNIISDFIKEGGFFNLTKDKNGKLLLSKTDWNSLLEKIKQQVGNRVTKDDLKGIDLIKNELKSYLDKQKTKDENGQEVNKFDEKQKQIIIEEFIDTVIAKFQPSTNETTDLERLIGLNNINNGVAFNESTQTALNKVLGLTNIEQETIDKIQALTVTAQQIVNGGSITSKSSSTNMNINRGAYAFQALAEIERKIKEILRTSKTDASIQQTVVKYMADMMGAVTTTLLINPNNATENVTTGIASNITESVRLIFQNPSLFFKSFGNNTKYFWTTWANYALGGASANIANEAELNNDIQSSERLRVREAMNRIKDKGLKGVVGVIFESPAIAISVFSRAGMNSFDAAFNSILLRKKMLSTTYNSIKAQGLLSGNTSATKLLDKVFNIDAKTKTDLETEANRIFKIMENAGFPVTLAFKAQTRQDLKMSLYEDVMVDVAIDKGATLRQATEATKSLIDAAQASAKELTGKKRLKSNDIVSSLIYKGADLMLAPQQVLFIASKKAEQDGKLGKAARIQSMASIFQNTMGKFVGGASNFLMLGVTSTPIGLMTAYSLNSQANKLAEKGAADVLQGNAQDVKNYAELKGMAKSILTRSLVGSLAVGLFLLKNLELDDDDENEEDGLNNLIKTKTGRRLMQKHLPMLISLSAPLIYKDDKAKEGVTETVLEILKSYTGKDYNAYDNFAKDIKKSKTDEDVKEAYAKIVSGIIPTANLNQAEQITKFKDAVGLYFDKNKLNDVEENERLSKEQYKELEGVMNNILHNGAINSIQRYYTNEKFNRFAK